GGDRDRPRGARAPHGQASARARAAHRQAHARRPRGDAAAAPVRPRRRHPGRAHAARDRRPRAPPGRHVVDQARRAWRAEPAGRRRVGGGWRVAARPRPADGAARARGAGVAHRRRAARGLAAGDCAGRGRRMLHRPPHDPQGRGRRSPRRRRSRGEVHPPMSFVVGTAGHIDHGKSTLITALTGIDPDRLAEEKRRGMTIDLGFAHMTLPSGREIGIVDVPGHARFVRNMLAGVHGLDAVVLVVAADEGVRPQTREHLEIIDLLEVTRGVVALTKVDLVDGEWIEMVSAEVAAALEDTSLRGARIVPVSAVARTGLDDLVLALDEVLVDGEGRRDAGRARLPVDRVFTISGFGTVVTGTLVDGALAVGQELDVVPRGRSVRVRGLQQHNRKVERVEPGGRVAVNVSGAEKDERARGDVLAPAGTIATTRRVDARVRVLGDAPRALRHGAELTLHTGTAEVGARAIVLEGDAIERGASGWVQLYLSRPIAASEQDRFVLRIPSPAATIAGGRFTDVTPRKHPRHDAAVRESLEGPAAGDVLQEELRKYPRGVAVAALLKATMAPGAGVESLDARRVGEWIWAREHWAAQAERVRAVLSEYHAAHPLRAGMPREELRSRAGLPPAAFGAALRGWVE